MNEIKFKVLVKCITFNQANYIQDALNGFCIQKTYFPFLCCIFDDFSTDGEQSVITKYLEEHFIESERENTDDYELIFAQHKTNNNCYFAVFYLKYNHYSKGLGYKKNEYVSKWLDNCEYVALCEGDDFWIDKDKLRTQAEIMDVYPDCSICYHRVQTVMSDGVSKSFLIPPKPAIFNEGKVYIEDLVKQEFRDHHWCFHTSSFFYRHCNQFGYSQFKKTVLPSLPYGDMPLSLYHLDKGGYFIDRTMGCYRHFSGGWNSNMLSNRQLKIDITQKEILGYREIDKFTNYKFHRIILDYNRRREYFILKNRRSLNPIYYKCIIEHCQMKFRSIMHRFYNLFR